VRYLVPRSLAKKERPPMKKEATPKHKGLKEEKPPMKKEATTKHNGLKKKEMTMTKGALSSPSFVA
jgi:ribosomal protein L9